MEHNTKSATPAREKIPFAYCEICGNAIPAIDESWYSGHSVNDFGYLCYQCVKAAVEQTYSEWASHKTLS